MGLAVAQALAAQGTWFIHLVDIKADEGEQAARDLGPNATFHCVNLRNYDALAAVFKAAYLDNGRRRLDFVFANAGLIERGNMFDLTSSEGNKNDEEPPPRPDYAALEVNLQGAVDTVHLARHYMLRSPEKDKGAIVITASCASVWPTYWAPIYSASKCKLPFLDKRTKYLAKKSKSLQLLILRYAHLVGILGFMRAIAGHYMVKDGIRVNALLPGAVKTPIIEWDPNFPEDIFTPMELIAETVLNLAAGGEIVDAKGVKVPPEKAYGQAVLAHRKSIYIIPEAEYVDKAMEVLMEGTRAENQFKKN